MRAHARESANTRARARERYCAQTKMRKKKNSKEGKIVSVFWIRVNNFGVNKNVTNNRF